MVKSGIAPAAEPWSGANSAEPLRRGLLAVRSGAAAALRRHARDDLPNECCGLLIGGAGLIERAERARNLRAAPDRYLIDPADHCAALRSARARGLQVVGAYHSHPTGSLRPSTADRREAACRGFIYLIVSARAGLDAAASLAAYRLTDAGFEEVALEIVP